MKGKAQEEEGATNGVQIAFIGVVAHSHTPAEMYTYTEKHTRSQYISKECKFPNHIVYLWSILYLCAFCMILDVHSTSTSKVASRLVSGFLDGFRYESVSSSGDCVYKAELVCLNVSF